MKRIFSIFIAAVLLLTCFQTFAFTADSAVDAIVLIKPDKNLDNNYSAAVMPGALDPGVTYEYGFATSNGGAPYAGPYGTWFETDSSGVGTYTKGLINNHVAIPITYYYIAPANDLWLVIRDKANPDDKIYLQLVPDILLMDNLTAANSFPPLGASFESFLSEGISGGSCFVSNGQLSPRIPVGVPFNYIYTNSTDLPANDNPGWSITMLQFDSPTSKGTVPDFLMYPQNPNAGYLYFKSITATAEADPAYFQSNKSARLIGSTGNPNYFGTPQSPDYITITGNAGIMTLNNLKPFTYEYILSDSETAPSDWSGAPTLQSSSGFANVSVNSEYIYIRTKNGSVLTQNSPTAKLAIPVDTSQLPPTGLSGVAPTHFGNIDGKITGTTSEMEYKLSTVQDYISAPDVEITGLVAGTYLVRYKATAFLDPSPAVEIIIPDGRDYYILSGYMEHSGVTISADTNTGTSDANGHFTINLQPGTYNLIFTRPGALKRTIPVTVTDTDIELSTVTSKITLILGDSNADNSINMSDLTLTKAQFNKTITDTGFNINYDITQDGSINISDLSEIKTNFGKTINSY